MEGIDIKLIKSALTMEDVCSEYGIRVERNKKALCPFHSDHRPSMQVYPNDGGFHCFVCGAHGSVIDFIKDYEKISFAEAVQRGAEIAHLVKPGESVKKIDRTKKSELNLERKKAQETQEEYIRLTTRMNTVLRPMAEKLEGFTMEEEITDDIERFIDEFAETEAKIDEIDERLRDYRERGIL